MVYIKVEKILCDDCGYLDSAEKFLDESSPNFENLVKKVGITSVTYAGAICPKCGNFSEFDFNPPSDLDPVLIAPLWHRTSMIIPNYNNESLEKIIKD